ncbi:hypothetical protein HPB48_002061 [Haemaphysalis longicornis]|uniref:DDE-1 domain-containing protein n=1 Tax=Haemaphysalis longicornis TaxID=44386 RepID=A0A9J6FGK3_HAELO|nr:hypothetical protein HPB48_002061 [Haemaphysalis longicornis]
MESHAMPLEDVESMLVPSGGGGGGGVTPLDLGIIRAFKASYRRRVVERLDIAVDRPAANLPLRVSLYPAVEMVKAAWSEVTATYVRNCFRKAGFVNTQPQAEPDACDSQSGGDLWQRVIDTDMGAISP